MNKTKSLFFRSLYSCEWREKVYKYIIWCVGLSVIKKIKQLGAEVSEEWRRVREGFLKKKVMCEQIGDDVRQQSLQTWRKGVPGRGEAGAKADLRLARLETHRKVATLEGSGAGIERTGAGSWGQTP